MKREDVSKIVPGITPEQLDSIMNLHGADITAKVNELASPRSCDPALLFTMIATAWLTKLSRFVILVSERLVDGWQVLCWVLSSVYDLVFPRTGEGSLLNQQWLLTHLTIRFFLFGIFRRYCHCVHML